MIVAYCEKYYPLLKDRLEKLFLFLFFVVSFLQYSSLTAGSIIISLVQWPTVFLGFLLLLIRLLFLRNYCSHLTTWLLCLFCGSYVASSIANLSHGCYANLRGFVFLLFEIFLLFASDSKEDASCARRKFKFAIFLFQIGTFLLSFISLILLIFRVSLVLPQEQGPVVVIGFAWGRLFGAHWDPNVGSAMAVVSFLFSLYYVLFSSVTRKKLFSYFNLLVQLGYLSFSDSRTGAVCVAFGVTFLSALWLFRRWKKKISNRKFLTRGVAVLLSALIFLLAVLAPIFIKQVSIGIESLFLKEGEVSFFEDSDRENDIRTDISNRRFDIWESAVELGMHKPVFGASHFNILSVVRSELPDSYLILNDHMDFDTMHNVLFDVFASQGFAGLLVFIATIVCSLISIFKYRKRIFSNRNFHVNSTCFSVIATVFLASMLMTEIVYVISPLTLIFWVSFGKLMRDMKE